MFIIVTHANPVYNVDNKEYFTLFDICFITNIDYSGN